VIFFENEKPSPIDQIQNRLMRLAVVFLFLYAASLTLAPAARLHSWQVEYRWNHWIGFATWLVGMIIVHHQVTRRLPDRDPLLLPIGTLLSGWGVLSIWRLDSVMGLRQTIWLGVCMAVLVAGLRLPDVTGFLRRYKYIWLTGGLLLTGLTFIFGTYPDGVGPRLWLGCCGIYLQPSEPLKLLLIVFLAAYLSERIPVSLSLMQLLSPTLILVGIALALLAAQRDLGTASLFILIYTSVVYLASHRRRTLVISLFILLLAGFTGYLMFDVVRIRVDAWLNPWLDPSGRSYQIVQSLLAVASGGILGRGPGLGSPSVVPISHSDFIFSSIAEETGLLGAAGLLLLFTLLVGRGFRAAMRAPNNYQRYLAAGITCYLAIQAIFITGGNLRLLPLTGVTLPFVSYGGSSLLTAYISLLLLLIISGPGDEEPAPLPHSTPYLVISGALMLGLLSLALVSGWWAVFRREGLLARPENPRRAINDRFVLRGALLDRNNHVITNTTGQPGGYTRAYQYPALAGTTGYNSPQYGQAGLEAGLDGYLRGLRGIPETTVLLQEMLYGQPPPGLDVRLTIDLERQKLADSLLEGQTGALVLMNAQTGEILAMASHPYFDPNQLQSIWPDLLTDPRAPLINRATQGQYPAGGALAPFLLAYARAQSTQVDSLAFDATTARANCAMPVDDPLTPEKMVASGCPAATEQLLDLFSPNDLTALYDSLGFSNVPALPLQFLPIPAQQGEQILVTPLQMALGAAALTNSGQRPVAQIAASILTPQQGWQILPNESPSATRLAGSAGETVEAMATPEALYWQSVSRASMDDQTITWYIGGTIEDWKGAPLALALALETDDPSKAMEIGQTLFAGILK
jgi:cell division protein FtsW (lipid II flippase)